MIKQLKFDITKPCEFFATSPKYLNELLAAELNALGAEIISTKLAGVIFRGNLHVAYQACLWSRLANRILLPLHHFPAENPDALYQGIQQIDWSKHLDIDATVAVDFSSTASKINHTQYGAQKVKDAIVDQFRSRFNKRPSVQLHQPDVMVNVYLFQDNATVSIDLAGESLHKRGYRQQGGEAPLKENLAAAILLRANWPEIVAKNGAFVDLMCGSATLPIEAALMAGNMAPGLLRNYFGFLGWKFHQADVWQQCVIAAKTKQIKITSPIIGYDADARVIKQGLANIANAGLAQVIHIEKRDLAAVAMNNSLQQHPGLVMANPPYGERLGEADQLQYLYRNIGDQFKQHFIGWRGAIFTGNPDLGRRMGVRAQKYYAFFNGAIPCRLLLFNIQAESFITEKASHIERSEAFSADTEIKTVAENDPIQMFINRLQKNYKHLQKWAERENIQCYRLYDADLPEYAVAIDRYANYIHVQEYAPPKSIDAEKAEQRLQAVIDVLPALLNVPKDNVFYKIRHKQSRSKQYEKLSQEKQLFTVQEYQAKLLVNLKDYLDTGLFLDQRQVRQQIFQLAKGKHFLNLFAYTGTATVFAALGGAASTTSVDLSATYLNWAKKNLALNGFSEAKNSYIQADCTQWLAENHGQYDVIFVAPPVFSRSKRMEETFDIQRDHANLLEKCRKSLSKSGSLIFATHRKGFSLDQRLLQHFTIQDWHKTLPLDFQRSAKHYFCWLLQRRA